MPMIRICGGGVNVNEKNRFEIYMKNCCVSLLSAKHYNPDSDVALVTNIEIPDEFGDLLKSNGILIINAEFDTFKFSDDYKWGLAFYKLCALKHVVENYDYEYVSYMDSDVYIQSDFRDIWSESEDSLLLYDINHGLQVSDYRSFLEDYTSFSGNSRKITHYGGEFFAASRENAEIFISECFQIYLKMLDKKFVTGFGDEFITSQAADRHKAIVKNAGAYVFRFWTGDFRLVSTCYRCNPITVLHVPAEKRSGMIKIYNYYRKYNRLPTNKTVYSMLNLSHIRFKTGVKLIIKRLLGGK